MQSCQTFDLKSLLIAFECSLCCASEHLWTFWYLWKWIDESKQPLGVICIHLLWCNGTAVLFYNICMGILVCSRWKPAHLPQCTAISDFLFMCWSLENYRRVLLKVEQWLSFSSIGTQECRWFHSDVFTQNSHRANHTISHIQGLFWVQLGGESLHTLSGFHIKATLPSAAPSDSQMWGYLYSKN